MLKKLILLFLLLICRGNLIAQLQLVLPLNHSKPISGFYESADGAYLLTSSQDEVKVWDVNSGGLLYTLPRVSIKAGSIAKGNKRLVTYAQDGKAFDVRNLADGVSILHLSAHQKYINSVSFSHDGQQLISAGEDSCVRTWDSGTGQSIHTFNVGFSTYNASFSPDDKLAVACTFKDIRIWDLKTLRLLDSVSLPANGGWQNAIICCENKYLVATTFSNPSPDYSQQGSMGFHIYIWDIQNHRLAANVSDQSTYTGFALSGDQKKLAKFSNGQAEVWDIEKQQQLYRGPADNSQSRFLALDYTGFRLLEVSGNAPARLHMINLRDTALNKYFDVPGLDKLVSNYRFSPDGESILVSTLHQELSALDIHTGRIINSFQGVSHNITALTQGSNPDLLYTQSDDPYLRIWDLKKARIVQTLKMKQSSAFSVVSPKYVVDYEYNPDHPEKDSILLMESLSGKLVKKIASTSYPIALSSDYKYLMTTDLFRYNILNIASGGQRVINPGAHGITDFHDITYNSRSEQFICIDIGHFQVSVWDAKTGYLLYKTPDKPSYSIENDAIQMAITDQSGKSLALVGNDKRLTLVDLPTGNARMVKADTAIISVTFSPDQHWVIAGEATGKIMLINRDNWQTVKTVTAKAGWIYKLAISDDGSKLLSASGDDIVSLWDFPSLIAKQTYAIKGTLQFADFPNNRIFVTDHSMISVIDLTTGIEKYSFAALMDNDFMVKLPDNSYFTTPGAARYLGWSQNGKRYDFDQWDITYNRPDKVLAAVGCADSRLIQNYYQAYLTRLNNLHIDPNNHPTGFPPECQILNNTGLKVIQRDSTTLLKLHFKEGTNPVTGVRLTINSVPFFRGGWLEIKSSHDTTITLSLPLGIGRNVVKISCRDDKGLQSARQAAYLDYLPAKSNPLKVYFVGLGANLYKYAPLKKLDYPDKDIRDLTAAFRERNPGMLVDTFTNDRVTPQILPQIRQFLSKAGINDKVIIVYCGHGTFDHQSQYYCASYLTNFQKPEEGGISYQQLEELLTGIPARQKLLLLDACNSGETGKSGSSQAGALIGGGESSFYIMQDLFANFSEINGTAVISAARGDQLAGEGGAIENGWFTAAVLQALVVKKEDKVYQPITVSELKNRVCQMVLQISGGRQAPTSRNEIFDQDWTL